MTSHRQRLLASTLIFGSAAFVLSSAAMAQTEGSSPPMAQPEQPAPATAGVPAPAPLTGASGAPAAVQEVVVTGSRIPQRGLTSVSPLTTVGSQEIHLEGTTNVESLLNNLPQAFAEQTSQVSNGATGIATANLRNLGSNRTLVLVDGKRLMPGDPTQPVADLNNIPAQLVDRVEVTTGGASAVYGSDAVAGVVNFVMKHNFQGVQFDIQGGFAQDDNSKNGVVDSSVAAYNQNASSTNQIKEPGSVVDGRTMDYSAIFGANTPDGKGNVTAYAEYRNLQPVTEDSRRYSACGLGTTNSTSSLYDTHFCAGSSNNANGRFSVISPQNTGFKTGTFSLNPNGTQSFVPYTSALAFNYAPYNYIQRNDDRYTGGFFAHYQVNPMFDLYSDFMVADDHTDAVIAPSGLFQGTGALGSGVNGSSTFAINCNNPLLSAAEATNLCGSAAGTATNVNVRAGFRFATGAPRTDDLRHTDYKIDIGSRGQLAPGWTYDAYLQYGTSILNENYQNDVSVSRVQNALLVDPTTGKCMVGGSCVPLNIFQLGKLSAAQLAYVETPGFESGQTIEQVANISITGDLGQYGVQSPLASDGVGVAFGTEYRRENLSIDRDAEFTSGDLSGQGGAALSNAGTFDVYELFGEIKVPLVEDKPFVKNLSFDGAYRFSDYSTAGVTNTYEAAFQYNVNSDIGFRAGYNRAVRAPNVNELFSPTTLQLFGGSDPCAGKTGTVTAGCLASGVTQAEQNAGTVAQCPAGQCTEMTGGNPNLKPETTDTITAGIVFTPTEKFLRGFTMTVDYFDIKVYNVIEAGYGGGNSTLNTCVETQSPVECNLVHRDSTGSIFGSSGYVVATEVNSGFLKTRGVDLEANYRFRPTDYFNVPQIGLFNLNFVSTYTAELTSQPVSGGGAYNCAGLYGITCGTPTPSFRAKTRLSWTLPVPVTLSVQWRYIGGTTFDGNSSNVLLNDGVGFDTVDKLGAYNYFDLAATWRVQDNLTLRAGVNNVGDRQPPVTDSGNLAAAGAPYGNGNTFPGVYDSLGRTFFFGLTANF
ncbi:MAG: TonB-dependent receptor plug domain-containing protein [Caulobacteraceae bacterium]